MTRDGGATQARPLARQAMLVQSVGAGRPSRSRVLAAHLTASWRAGTRAPASGAGAPEIRGGELGGAGPRVERERPGTGDASAPRPRLPRYVSGLARAVVRATRRLARRMLPDGARRRLGALWRGREYLPPAGCVRFGDLRRLTPISRKWGKDRGKLPVDRYYIETFLTRHAHDIGGRVLEVQDASYTRRFGGNRVTRSDVLHAAPGNAQATIVADLVSAPHIASDTFDCIILTQVLPFIQDVPSAIRTIHRILRPGGVVLATVPGISQIVRHDMERWGDYWRFTTLSARQLFARVFPASSVQVEAYGNVLVATAFLHGLAAEELRPAELEHHDADFELLITIRATKPAVEILVASDGGRP